MANEERPVRIASWPGEASQLEVAAPRPVSLVLSAAEPFPVCLSVCEPICAESDYEVSVTIFDRPVATIHLRGQTRLRNCDEREHQTVGSGR